MADLVSWKRLPKEARTLLWTALIAAGLLAIDRTAFGPSIPDGWNETRSIESLPGRTLPALPPPYLPNTLAWPPQRVLFRVKPSTGWWLAVSDAARTEVRLWIGSGEGPLPASVQHLSPCMSEQLRTRCPDDWSFSSTQLGDGTIYVFSKLDAQETKRILLGLQISPR